MPLTHFHGFFFLPFNARRGKHPHFWLQRALIQEFGDFHLLHMALFLLGRKPLVGLAILAVVSNPNDAAARRRHCEHPRARLTAVTPSRASRAPGSTAGIPQRRHRSGADVSAAGMDPAPAAPRRHLLAARSPRPLRGWSSRSSASCPSHSRPRPRPARSAQHSVRVRWASHGRAGRLRGGRPSGFSPRERRALVITPFLLPFPSARRAELPPLLPSSLRAVGAGRRGRSSLELVLQSGPSRFLGSGSALLGLPKLWASGSGAWPRSQGRSGPYPGQP